MALVSSESKDIPAPANDLDRVVHSKYPRLHPYGSQWFDHPL